MRCQSCNALLNDFESTRRHLETLAYIDLCNRCFSMTGVFIPVIENEDIMWRQVIEDELEEMEYNYDREDDLPLD